FFFQAEDGIRDRNVTGVQTCALPIFLRFATPEPTPTSASARAMPVVSWARRALRVGRSCRRCADFHPRIRTSIGERFGFHYCFGLGLGFLEFGFFFRFFVHA